LRALSTSSVLRKDFVQELYLKELKTYKAPPAAQDAHVGAVKPLVVPSAPTPPSFPSSSELASELEAYESSQPTLADAAPVSSSSNESAAGAQAFLQFLEQDLPKDEAHH